MSRENTPIPTPEKPSEELLCPGCLTPHEPMTYFCSECGMPLSPHATLDPLKQVYAQGWVYRRVIRYPTKLGLIGLWLLFMPIFFMLLISLQGIHRLAPGRTDSVTALISPVLVAGLFAVYAVIVFVATRHYVRTRSMPASRCEQCGYDLRGLRESRCPECGSSFDPEELEDDESEKREEDAEEEYARLWTEQQRFDWRYARSVVVTFVLLHISAFVVGFAERALSSESVALVAVTVAFLCWGAAAVFFFMGLYRIARPKDAGSPLVFTIALLVNVASLLSPIYYL
jgi:hypothetical protein